MAVGEHPFPFMYPVAGVRLGSAGAGIKYPGRDDVVLMELAEGGNCAAVFTRNAFCAAPVTLAKQHLAHAPRWLLINSGNANAGTGQAGLADAEECCRALAEQVGGGSRQVLPFSTGVIGERLPVAKLAGSLPEAVAALSEQGWERAARAIMTTDTRPKGVSFSLTLGGEEVRITGIAKGAGMIQPDMATMLAFIATDAGVSSAGLLQKILVDAVDRTFNCITVDGDTSTNDACVLLASGCSKAPVISEDSEHLAEFSAAVERVCASLAESIVRDGEGATKLIRIQVEEAADEAEARGLAKTIAHSPLVKTAFFASDPNWGRILAAVGRAGIVGLDIARVAIHLGDVCIVRGGERAAEYTEQAGQAVMANDEIDVRIALGRGPASQRVLSCDFSYDYVRINAEYRT